MIDVFLSYAREDADRIRPIADYLSSTGLTVWWDRDIQIGQTFDEIIGERLREARCVAVFWTEVSVTKRWVRDEAQEGLDHGHLIPILLDPVALPLGFRRVQTLDFSRSKGKLDEQELARLAATVAHVLDERPREQPLEAATGAATSVRDSTPSSERMSRRARIAMILVAPMLVLGAILYWWFDESRGRNEPSTDTVAGLDVDIVACVLADARVILKSNSECQESAGSVVSLEAVSLGELLKAFQPALDAGDAEAEYVLGQQFEKGIAGTPPDYEGAAKYYQLAAEKHHKQAQVSLGLLYEKGLGVQKNNQKAALWYRKALGLGEDEVRLRAPAAEPAKTEPIPIDKNIAFGKYHALVIGNNHYQHLPNSKTAVSDAKAVAQLLTSKYGFRVTTLIDANRYDILSALNNLRVTLGDKDSLLIYYAGLGELDRVNQRAFWLPVDAEPDSSQNWISYVAITDILNAMSVRHALVVSDSAFSGAFTSEYERLLQPADTTKAQSKWIKARVERPSRTVLASGGLKPVLDSGGGDHSVFARAFLDALNENDGVLPGNALAAEVNHRVTEAASRLQIEQDPKYGALKFAGDGGGEFFFVPHKDPNSH